MAIGADAAVVYWGTTDAVDDTSTSAVNDGAISAAADITAWTNTDDAPVASLILLWQYPSGTINGNIAIHVRPINIDGTNDEPVPTYADQRNFAGFFDIATGQSATTNTAYMAQISLKKWMMKTSQEFEFYLINDSGVQMSANWDLDIAPDTFGPNV